MLKYSIKAHLPQKLNEISFDDLYLAKDLSYISGTAAYYNDLIDGEIVSVSSPYIEGNANAKINAKLVTRQGYILTYEKIPLQTLSNVGDEGLSINYIEYNGSFYYEFKDSNFDGFLINGFFYERGYDDTITIPIKHWIEDGVVTIQGKTYDVDMNLVPNSAYPNGYEQPTAKERDTDEILEKVDGKSIEYHDYEYSAWKKCYNFVIYNKKPEMLDVSSATTAMYFPFIQYENEIYPIQEIQTTYTVESGDIISAETFGALINDTVYPFDSTNVISGIEEFNTTDTFDQTIEIDGNNVKVYTALKSTDEGKYIILYSDLPLNDFIMVGDLIEAESFEEHFEKVEIGNNDKPVVFANGKMFEVKENLCDYITLDNDNFTIVYINEDKTKGYVTINDKIIYLDFFYDNDGKRKAIHTNKLYNKASDGTITYSKQEKSTAFIVTEQSGITIDNVSYPIVNGYAYTDRRNVDDSTDLDVIYGCYLPVSVKYQLAVSEVYGSNAILCEPYLQPSQYGISGITIEKAEEINRNIIDNFHNVHFTLKTTLFGNGVLNPEDFANDALYADHPFSTIDVFDFKEKLKIYKITDYLTLPVNLSVDTDSSLYMDDILAHEFVEEKAEEAINNIVDMEKDIYYPCYRSYANGKIQYQPISKLVFNLHFRTRNLESWKVIQDDTEDLGKVSVNGKSYTTPFYSKAKDSNWFITDYAEYKNQFYDVDFCNKIQMSSDLVGFLNFTDEDVKYSKSKINKSFLRLSFYSTPNPHTQMLMATSTIFMDGKALQQKYLRNFALNNQTYKEIRNETTTSITSSNTINVIEEKYNTKSEKIELDENCRLSSQLTVQNKYETDNSAESFYLYLFKEYSTGLRENTLYLKIDFCHAGTGMVIPFIFPTASYDNETPLYLSNPDDLLELKDGISMEDLYNHIYIPIKVIYDEVSKKYYYYLPDSLIVNNQLGVEDNSIMMFNLFELKLKNQSID
jgi:hypothetical protein